MINISRRKILKSTALIGAGLLLNPSNVFASYIANEDTRIHSQTKFMLGTIVNINIAHHDNTLVEQAFGKVFEEIARLEKIFTRYDNSAPLAILHNQGKLLDAPRELTQLLQRCSQIHNQTNQAFDISITPLLNVYNKYQNRQGSIDLNNASLQAELKQAKELISAKDIHVAPDHIRLGRMGMELTLDGIAKGHIADMASQVLLSYGLENHLINAGGDIKVSGQKLDNKGKTRPWRIGIENPLGNEHIANVNLNTAIATSGNYEKYFDAKHEYHHIINPEQKASPKHNLSVTVIAPTALKADALATALSIMPTQEALKLTNSLANVECCILLKDKRILSSNGFFENC